MPEFLQDSPTCRQNSAVWKIVKSLKSIYDKKVSEVFQGEICKFNNFYRVPTHLTINKNYKIHYIQTLSRSKPFCRKCVFLLRFWNPQLSSLILRW